MKRPLILKLRLSESVIATVAIEVTETPRFGGLDPDLVREPGVAEMDAIAEVMTRRGWEVVGGRALSGQVSGAGGQ